MTYEVLYIHPSGHLNDLTIPMGAISSMNTLEVPHLGRYAFEVSDDELRAARVVVVDFHWGFSAPFFDDLVRHVRKVNPNVAIVVGGISASLLSEELLATTDVDYIVVGDSEHAFPMLVEALLAGEAPGPIPNVASRQTPRPARRRVTPTEFARTDTLDIRWFPTLNSYVDWQAAAFSHGRFVSFARGCVMRCPTCYGAVHEAFGQQVPKRRPQELARVLRRARDYSPNSPQVFLGRLSLASLERLAHGLREAGPLSFASPTPLFLCTAPSRRALRDLKLAFPGGVVLSFVAPSEIVPQLKAATVTRELAMWQDAFHLASEADWLVVDAWTVAPNQRPVLQSALQSPGAPPVPVNLGLTWEIVRPGLPDRAVTYSQLVRAARDFWTFLAARLLSPPLERCMQVFEELDDVLEDPEEISPPVGFASQYWPRLMDTWRRYRLPQIPDLSFVLVPTRPSSIVRDEVPERLQGEGVVAWARGERLVLDPTTAASRVVVQRDFRGVRLEAALDPTGGNPHRAYAMIPFLGEHPTREGIRQALSEKVLVLTWRHPHATEVKIEIVLHQARIRILGRGDLVVGRGRVSIPFLKPQSFRETGGVDPNGRVNESPPRLE